MMGVVFGRFLGHLLDIVYPKTCLACRKDLGENSTDGLVCAACWQGIKRNTPPFCCSCGRNLGKANIRTSICPACQRAKWHFDRAFSPCAYEGPIKELIHAFKYSHKDHLGQTLSRLMIDFINEFHMPIDFTDLIIPIPLHSSRLREREFNQADLLSEFIAKEFNKPVRKDLLRRSRPTKTQTDLDNRARLLNVRGSFSANRPEELKDKKILLMDDVLTTGATASEAAKALKQAGAAVVFVLTLAN